MGDRCYMTVTIHESHKEQFLKAVADATYLGEPDSETESDEGIELEWSEVNYAASVGCTSKDDPGGMGDFPKGFPLIGEHMAGGCYGPGVFATTGDGVMHYCNTDHDATGPVVRVDANGIPSEDGMQAARDYHKAHAEIHNTWDDLDSQLIHKSIEKGGAS